MLIIVNIPAYNEAKKIGRVIKSISRDFVKGATIKIQVVDDGSEDDTVDVSKNAGADYVYKMPHRGLGLTFRSGVEKALLNGADIMVNIDADGQFSPDDIPKLVKPVLSKKADMVVASRFSQDKELNPQRMPFIKKALNLVIAKIVGIFWGQKIDDLTCGFRAYSREVLLKLNLNYPFTYTQETIIDALSKNFNINWVPVRVEYFEKRKSRMTGKMWFYIFQSTRIIVSMLRDTKPMKFFGIPAIFFISCAAIIFLVFLIYYLGNFKVTPFRTWLSLASILLILGIQLLVFALIADMIKSQRQVSEENLYLIRKERYKKEIPNPKAQRQVKSQIPSPEFSNKA